MVQSLMCGLYGMMLQGVQALVSAIPSSKRTGCLSVHTLESCGYAQHSIHSTSKLGPTVLANYGHPDVCVLLLTRITVQHLV